MVLPWRAIARKYLRSFQSNMQHYAILLPRLAILWLPLAPAIRHGSRRSREAAQSSGSRQMRDTFGLFLMLVLTASAAAQTRDSNLAKPNLLLEQVVAGMPKSDKQDLRVLTATFNPGDKTVYHSHRFPVTVYVLEGTFTLELEGHEPIVVKADEAL